ncbi:hypothetical protein NHP200010_15420 [Helicobacter bizzozeronii]|nr:hypothetical protein NHP200010_15420 [Helicobacter bizzozeronii]
MLITLLFLSIVILISIVKDLNNIGIAANYIFGAINATIAITNIQISFANLKARLISRSTTFQAEISLLNTYQKYIDSKHNALSIEHKTDIHKHFLKQIDIYCKYILDGLLIQNLCGDTLKEYIQTFYTPYKEKENKTYKNIENYMEKYYPQKNITT